MLARYKNRTTLMLAGSPVALMGGMQKGIIKMNENKFDYYYGNESEQFIFYRIPKVLFIDDKFKKLSTEAKVLYGLMLDRMGLSIKNNWCDDDNRVFIIYTQEEATDQLNCSRDKIIQLYKELDDIGLIERKRQGQGRPTWIYVKNFISNVLNNKSDIQMSEKSTSRGREKRHQDIGNSDIKKSEKSTSRHRKNQHADVGISDTSNTDINNTDYNYIEINHINQSASENEDDDVIDKMDTYRQIIHENIEYDILIQNHGKSKIDELVELIVENVCFPKKVYYIDNIEYPAEIVKSRLLKLNSSHIDYVFDCMKKNPSKISNIKNYLIAALYNSFTTMDSYYTADYNSDSVL